MRFNLHGMFMALSKKIIVSILIVTLIVTSFFFFSSFVKKEKKSITMQVVYDSTAFAKSKDTVLYSLQKKLSWLDFKTTPPLNVNTVANSSVGFKFNAGIRNKNDDIVVIVKISSFFIRSKSWGKDKNKTDYILKHEQKHFDLSRYGAELFRRSIALQKLTENNINQCLQNAYSESWNTYVQLQAQYDKETNHSINKAKQEIWNIKIDSLLRECK
jgi:hypothetical protein